MKVLLKENEINKLVKEQRSSGKKEYLLFTSLWDKVSCILLNKIKKKNSNISLNIINSFDTPHSFIIWNITRTPSLVILDGAGATKKVIVSEYTTDVYKRLGLE